MGQVPNCIANYASSDDTEEVRVVLSNSETEAPFVEPTDAGSSAAITMLRRSQLLLRSSPLSFSDIYKCGRTLGEGACSRVFAGSLVQGSIETVAVKEFPSRHRRLFEVERQTLAGLEHPHIVRLYACFAEENAIRLALELCSGGDLFKRIQEERGLAEIAAQRIFWQMTSAVAYLHAIWMLHQDLKVENWLLVAKGADVVKLCDFGTVVILSSDRPRERRPLGTFSYKAPEAHSGMGVSTFADVWALGVGLYTMLLGADPFLRHGDSDDAVRERIINGSIQKESQKWSTLALECRELLDQLFSVDETKRPDCNRVLVHPWVLHGKPCIAASSDQSEEDALAVHAAEIVRLMEQFSALHPLQQLLLVLCARIPSSLELQALCCGQREEVQCQANGKIAAIPWNAIFVHLDADRDGKLGIGELRRGLSPFAGPDLRNWLSVIDNDGSGAIDWPEWFALALLDLGRNGLLTQQVELIDAVAQLLDTPTGDGRICEDDLVALLPAASAGSKRLVMTTWISQVSSTASSPPGLHVEDLHRLLGSEELCSRTNAGRTKM